MSCLDAWYRTLHVHQIYLELPFWHLLIHVLLILLSCLQESSSSDCSFDDGRDVAVAFMRTSLYCAVQYSTVQYSTVQYSTVQYSTVQYSTVQYSTLIADLCPHIYAYSLRWRETGSIVIYVKQWLEVQMNVSHSRYYSTGYATP
jgi:hypothetical protein